VSVDRIITCHCFVRSSCHGLLHRSHCFNQDFSFLLKGTPFETPFIPNIYHDSNWVGCRSNPYTELDLISWLSPSLMSHSLFSHQTFEEVEYAKWRIIIINFATDIDANKACDANLGASTSTRTTSSARRLLLQDIPASIPLRFTLHTCSLLIISRYLLRNINFR